MNDAVFLGLGSNLGDRAAQMQFALAALVQGGCELIRLSSIYETPPWGLENQPSFYNAVAQVRFSGSPSELLQLGIEVEGQLGRIRTLQWGPRLIDIDLLAFGQLELMGQRLVVPHPMLHLRAFVLVPWEEIAPTFLVPGHQKSVSELNAALPFGDRSAVARVGTLQIPA